MNGSGGCNKFTGGYAIDGDRLTLSQIGATMMACIDGMETEAAFLKALGRVSAWRVSAWRVTGQHLDLSDAAGVAVARFEAVYLR